MSLHVLKVVLFLAGSCTDSYPSPPQCRSLEISRGRGVSTVEVVKGKLFPEDLESSHSERGVGIFSGTAQYDVWKNVILAV